MTTLFAPIEAVTHPIPVSDWGLPCSGVADHQKGTGSMAVSARMIDYR